MMIKNIGKTEKGYTLVETIFYVSLFALLSVVVLDVLITMTGLFMKTVTHGDIVQGSTMIESISRELKQADDFSFNSPTLTVNTRETDGSPKTIVYTFSSSNIGMIDSVLGNLGNLNTPNVSVVSFNVATINTSQSKAAKINLTVKSNRDAENNTEDFQNTVVLRGSY